MFSSISTVYSLVAVIIVSAISFAGVFTLALQQQHLRKILLYLVSFSAGALLGDVFLHILPQIGEVGFGLVEGAYFLCGILMFFVLERWIFWHHSHLDHEESVHSVTYLVMVGDTLHNFIDGLVIAASFLVNPAVGLATTIAVIAHEIPQEIGDFGVLIHGGWKIKKALFYNFLSGLAAVVGALVVLLFARNQQGPPIALLAFAGSGLIYIAMSDLIPELHKEKSFWKSVYQLLCLLLGILVMALLLYLE